MLLGNIFIGVICGTIAGLVWSFALGIDIKTGLMYGAIIGAIVGFLFIFFQKAALSGGRLTKTEVGHVSGSFMGLILIAAIVIAVIVWIVRAIF